MKCEKCNAKTKLAGKLKDGRSVYYCNACGNRFVKGKGNGNR